MSETILPSFIRYANEGQIIGRIIAGYGELEFSLALALGPVLGDDEMAIRALFRTRGEEQRIEIADALMREFYTKLNLNNRYTEALADMHWCRRIRNQYAHCHWHDTDDTGLGFLELEKVSQKPNATTIPIRSVTLREVCT